jgi:hypothetical protein
VPLWSDEFDGNTIDPEKWGFDLGNGPPDLPGWGNNELQTYTDAPANARVGGGLLTISALRQQAGGGGYTSARLTTKGKAAWCPGMTGPSGQNISEVHIEGRMKLPDPGTQAEERPRQSTRPVPLPSCRWRHPPAAWARDRRPRPPGPPQAWASGRPFGSTRSG